MKRVNRKELLVDQVEKRPGVYEHKRSGRRYDSEGKRIPHEQRMDARSSRARSSARRVAQEVQDAAENGGAEWQQFHERKDGWRNALTKLGERFGDKRMAGRFGTERIPDLEAEDLWRGDGMAARVVEEVPNQIIRAGAEFLIQKDPAQDDARAKQRKDRIRWMKSERGQRWVNARIDSLPCSPVTREMIRLRITEDLSSDVFPTGEGQDLEDDSKEQQEAVSESLEELGWWDSVHEAMKAENGYGGSAIFPIIRDGETDLSKPLDYNSIEEIAGLDVLTPLELVPFQWYADPTNLYFGRPELYWMQRISIGNIGATARVPIHESRLITFPGIYVSRRQLREHWGWGDSVLVRCREVLRDFNSSHQAVATILLEFATAMLKMDGVVDSFRNGKDDLLLRRAQAFKDTMSIARLGIVDKLEEITRLTTPVGGMAELLDRQANWLAAHFQMPVTIMMGQAPAGLNATGASDLRAWYDQIDRQRRHKLTRRARKFMTMLFASKRGPTRGAAPSMWSWKWGHLWQPTEKEQAEARYIVAQADQIYLAAGVLIPEEVAKSRFGGDEYSAETQLDVDIRAGHDQEIQVQAELESQEMQTTAQHTAEQAAAANASADGGEGTGGGGGGKVTAPIKTPPVMQGRPGSATARVVAAQRQGRTPGETPAGGGGKSAKGGKQANPNVPGAKSPSSPLATPGGSLPGGDGAAAGPKLNGKQPPASFPAPKGSKTEQQEPVTAGENEIPTTGDFRKGAGGTEPPPQPPTGTRYKIPKDTAMKIPGPEVPVGKLQGPQSI